MSDKELFQNSTYKDEISVKDLVSQIKEWIFFLKSKWVIILAVGLIGGVLGFLKAYMTKPNYTATLTFALEDDKNGGGLGGALSLASNFGLDLGISAGGAFSGSNLIELMKSRKMVEKTLLDPVTLNNKQITFAEMYLQFNGLREKWEKKEGYTQQTQFLPGSDRSKYTVLQDSILGVIYKALMSKGITVAQKDKKISIISIDVKTENELFSKLFAEMLAKEVSDFYIETKSKKAKLNLFILEKQVDSIRNELNGAITGVAVANDNTFNLNPALNVRRTPSAKRQVDVQANTAILTELVKNLELARVTLRKETPLIQVIDSPILPLEKEKASKRDGLILGGLLGSFLTMLFFVTRKWAKGFFE